MTPHMDSDDPTSFAVGQFFNVLINPSNERLEGRAHRKVLRPTYEKEKRPAIFAPRNAAERCRRENALRRQRKVEREEILARLEKAIAKVKYSPD